MNEKKRTTRFVAGSPTPVLYTNSIDTSISTFDIRMRLGQVQSTTESAVNVRAIADIFMSHQHFLEFVASVNRTAQKLAARGITE